MYRHLRSLPQKLADQAFYIPPRQRDNIPTIAACHVILAWEMVLIMQNGVA